MRIGQGGFTWIARLAEDYGEGGALSHKIGRVCYLETYQDIVVEKYGKFLIENGIFGELGTIYCVLGVDNFMLIENAVISGSYGR